MGLTLLDTGVMVGFLDGSDPFHGPSVTAIGEGRRAGTLAMSAISYAETQVGVIRAGADPGILDTLLERFPIALLPIDRAVARRAAEMRAIAMADRRRRQWRMPDALVVATGIVADATTIVTTDARWPELSGAAAPIVEVLEAAT